MYKMTHGEYVRDFLVEHDDVKVKLIIFVIVLTPAEHLHLNDYNLSI